MKTDVWSQLLYSRVTVLAIVFIFFFCLLMLRLWQVQVMEEDDYLVAVDRESIRPERVNAIRGRIYASGGEALVDNQAVYDLGIFISEMRRSGRVQNTIEYIMAQEDKIMRAIGREPSLTEEELWYHLRRRPVQPLIIARNLTEKERAIFAEYFPVIDGLKILPRILRWHPYPGVASHILGFTGMNVPDGSDLPDDLPRMYVTSEICGKNGLEQVFNTELCGMPGSRKFRVDSMGYARENIGEFQPPVNGSDLYLTIDLGAQRAAEEVLSGYRGALVVIEVNTGAIVAMASSPTYNLEGLTSGQIVEMSKNEVDRPMINRATRGIYTPGSIIKPLVALAALENNVVLPDDVYECTGSYKIGEHAIRCANRWGHGVLNLNRAISLSCNPYFINVGTKCGIDRLTPFFTAAGFGNSTGVELSDAAGVAPMRELGPRRLKRQWNISDTAYVSIGQGMITITPLQAAVYAAALANGGTVYRPYLIREIRSQDGKLELHTIPEVRNLLPVSAENMAIVRKAMRLTVSERKGGASGLQKADFELAGKTGTAEVGHGAGRYKNTWTIAFGPYSDPQYAVACVIEHGDSGAKTTVPLVAQFFQLWLNAE